MMPTLVNAPIDASMTRTHASDDTASDARVDSQRLDVLFVLACLAVGGSERKIARMSNKLREQGMTVGLAAINGPYTLEPTLRRDVPVHKLERRGKFSLRALWKLRQIIARERPTTVFAVNLYPALYVALAAAFLRNRPRIVALINTSTFRGRNLVKRLYQRVLNHFDHTVHGSRTQQRFWQPVDDGRSSVIYNGVDSAFFEPTNVFEASKRLREKLGVKGAGLLIGTVGCMRPEKNQEVLLTTLRRLRVAGVDAHLVIAGDGPMRVTLLRRATELEVADRLHLVGEVDDVRPVLGALDVFVLPSVAVESFSNAALEAMSMARPVILSDVGGAREMIDDGVEGYVVSPTELAARLPALIAALHAEPRKRLQMGQAARARAVSCFSVAAMSAAYSGLIGNSSGTTE